MAQPHSRSVAPNAVHAQSSIRIIALAPELCVCTKPSSCAIRRVRRRVVPSVLVINRSNLQQCIDAAMNACMLFIMPGYPQMRSDNLDHFGRRANALLTTKLTKIGSVSASRSFARIELVRSIGPDACAFHEARLCGAKSISRLLPQLSVD